MTKILAEANARYLKASNALTASHAEQRAFRAPAHTVAEVRAFYAHHEAIRLEFEAAKAALSAAERA